VKIALRQDEKFGECTGLVDNSEDSAVGAVASESPGAPGASVTGQIDFADDAFAEQIRVIRLNHLAGEFVAGSAREIIIAALQFEVGIADASREKANEGKTGRRNGPRGVT
jgi:hypothetical protein